MGWSATERRARLSEDFSTWNRFECAVYTQWRLQQREEALKKCILQLSSNVYRYVRLHVSLINHEILVLSAIDEININRKVLLKRFSRWVEILDSLIPMDNLTGISWAVWQFVSARVFFSDIEFFSNSIFSRIRTKNEVTKFNIAIKWSTFTTR